MNRGQYHTKKETVTCLVLEHGVIVKRITEQRVINTRSNGARYIRAMYGRVYPLNAQNEWRYETQANSPVAVPD